MIIMIGKGMEAHQLLATTHLGAIFGHSGLALLKRLLVLDVDQGYTFGAFPGKRDSYGIAQATSTSGHEGDAWSDGTTAK